MIEEVIGDPVMMVMMAHKDEVEIRQDEEPREEEPGAPERIRNPVIQIIIVPWRRIVRYNRWPFLIIIIVNFLWLNVFAACRGLIFRVLAGSRRDR